MLLEVEAGGPGQQVAVAGYRQRLLHLLARDVGGELHALDLELELVRIGGALERILERDQAALVQLEERLIEGLHAVLAGAQGDLLADVLRLLFVLDALAGGWRGGQE